MTDPEHAQLLRSLASRFGANPHRHRGIAWTAVLARLKTRASALSALARMEATGGEPDAIGQDTATGQIIFCGCSAQSPAGRRSRCHDRQALQQLGAFDLKTSSWMATPQDVRSLGGALFCDRRYGRVFTDHNGAQSCDAARGFRGQLLV